MLLHEIIFLHVNTPFSPAQLSVDSSIVYISRGCNGRGGREEGIRYTGDVRYDPTRCETRLRFPGERAGGVLTL